MAAWKTVPSGSSTGEVLLQSGVRGGSVAITEIEYATDTVTEFGLGAVAGPRSVRDRRCQRNPAFREQVGQAFHPCACSTFSAMTICCDRVAWLAVLAKSAPRYACPVPTLN